MLLSETGRKKEAEGEFREAIHIGPEDGVAHYNPGLLLVNTGREAEAKQAFAEAKRLESKKP